MPGAKLLDVNQTIALSDPWCSIDLKRPQTLTMNKPPTILIVEDDPVFRRVLDFTVAKAGFKSETASNGEEGFQRLLQGDVDFLVTDLQMPVCTGLELLQRLESLDGFTRPNTILCTAKGLELDTEELRKRFNLIAIMHKPFSPRKLSDLITRTVRDAESKSKQSHVEMAMPASGGLFSSLVSSSAPSVET